MTTGPDSFSLYYHQQTKYTPEGIARSAKPLDWENQPYPFKSYPVGTSLDLKPYLLQAEILTEDPVIIEERKRISKLLYLSYGVTAVVPYPDNPFYMRSAPSAGGLYPAEIYLVSRGTQGFPAGLYNYQVKNHSLIRFWDSPVWDKFLPPCFLHPYIRQATLALVTTTVFDRSRWRYQDRAYRRVYLDTGHLLGNIELASALLGFHAGLLGGFYDDGLADLLYLNIAEEAPSAVVALLENPGGERTEWEGRLVLPSEKCIDYPEVEPGALLNFIHSHSKIGQSPRGPQPAEAERDKYNFPFCLKVSTEAEPIIWQDKLEETIIQRRSTRQFTGEDLTIRELLQILSFTYLPSKYDSQGFDPNPEYFDLSLLETFVAVTGVLGIDEGCYYYAPQARELRQIRFKNFRREINYLCLGQDLGRDAGAIIFHTADLKKAVERYGERAYRYLHMDAGHLGQRINLAAIRLDLGVSGIAGFFDDQVNEVLGIPEDEAVLYITALGRPSRRGNGS